MKILFDKHKNYFGNVVAWCTRTQKATVFETSRAMR